jgi:phosphoribosylformylglycinamidine synthase
MKFGVVVFPGSNSDRDLVYVLREVMGFDTVELWHGDRDLKGADFVFLPGGFSYGDYLRSGAIARFSPIMDAVAEHAKKGGYVMGICNGFQILCEAGLLPGVLLHNESHKYISKNVYIRPQSGAALPSAEFKSSQVLSMPIAHAEGRYFADAETLKQLNDNDQVMFRYCSSNGTMDLEHNPNGSAENIAGICDASYRVFGMMPHPERASDERLHNTDGKLIFQSILEGLEELELI